MKGYQTKKDIVYDTLKQEIYEGVYGFDEKLVISHLAKRFSSSEIPVREALNQLKSDGLIKFRPHVGAVVNSLSKEDIKNIFELRIELEGLATRLAIANLNEDDIDELQRINEASAKAIEVEDYSSFSQYNIDFHMKIYEKCENDLLIKMIQDLWNNTNRYPPVFKSNLEYVKQSLQEHEEIFNALKQKNSVDAELIMLKHKARAAQEILKISTIKGYEDLDQKELQEVQSASAINNINNT